MAGKPNEVELLKEHGLKKTHARVRVLTSLIHTKHALSHAEIEKAMLPDADRVTVYRVLLDLENSGIIHKTFDHMGVAKYALCASDCASHQHHDEHVHFHCTSCNETMCLDTLKAPTVKLPKGYALQSVQLAVTGICKNCQ